MVLWQKVLIGFVLGILFGVYFPEYAISVKFIGVIFLNLISLLVLPLIFCVLIFGITSIRDSKDLGRVGFKSVAAYLSTTIFAASFGLTIAVIFKPGVGVPYDLALLKSDNLFQNYSFSQDASEPFSFIKFFTNLFPRNIVNSFLQGNLLQIVFLAIFTGVVINQMMPKTKSVVDFFHIITKILIKMISNVILLSPYGAFSLTAWVIGYYGTSIISSLSYLVLSIVLAMGFQYCVFGILILIFCRVSPIPFYRKSLEYQVVALSTGSSKASLATTMKVCREKLGISESSTSFILPLGTSINMDGMAINLGLTSVFFAQMMNVELSAYDYFMIIFMSTVGSIGAAGLPSASLIALPLILPVIGLPAEAVVLVAGIDRVLDLLRTLINITGDATITLIVDHSENKLDKKRYFS